MRNENWLWGGAVRTIGGRLRFQGGSIAVRHDDIMAKDEGLGKVRKVG